MTLRHAIGKIIEVGCFLALLAIVGLRPLIAETYDSASSVSVGVLSGVSDPSPAATLIIDGVILLVALGWFVSRLLTSQKTYRACGLEWGALLLSVCAGASCLAAGNARLAINGALDWVLSIVLLILAVQMMHDAWRVRLMACVLIATAAAQATECFHQEWLVFPETESLYRDHREAYWSGQGVPLASDRVKLFEARMRAREATGYFPYSNVAGAHLAMCGLLAIALGVSGLFKNGRQRLDGSTVARIAVAICLFAAMALTRSRAAIIATSLSGLAYAVRLVFAKTYHKHRRTVFISTWFAVLLATTAVVGHGLYWGSLPGRSLDFRWHYWTAAATMIVERPITGYGSGNFGRHYLKLKTIDSPEEVKDPHNMLVSAATDWGLGGLVGMLIMIFGVSRLGTSSGGIMPTERHPRPPPSRACVAGWGFGIAAGIFLPRLWLLGSDDVNYVYFATVLPLTVWGISFVVLMPRAAFNAASLAVGAGFAIAAFLLQDMVNFASHVPGALTTAAAVTAVLIAARYCSGQLSRRHTLRGPLAWTGVTAALLAGVVGVVILPVARSSASITQARRMGATRAAVDRFDDAARADRLDSRPLYECARLLRFMSSNAGGDVKFINDAIDRINRAIQRDPNHLLLRQERSRCYLARATLTHDAKDYASAVEAARSAAGIYPNSPDVYEQLGDRLAAFGQATKSDTLSLQAVDAYRRALAIDQARPEWEHLRRLSPEHRASLERRIAVVESTRSDRDAAK